MSVRHPVPDELLLDYAVGSAGPGKALLVASHLAMCPNSQRRYAMLQEVGGALQRSLDGAKLGQAGADDVLTRADACAANADEPPSHAMRGGLAARTPELGGKLREIRLPAPLARFAGELEDSSAWRALGFGIEAATLAPVSSARGKTQLLRARAGVRIAEHTHAGEELVLVLQGAFWDGGERFGPGDVAVNDGSRAHSPAIDDAEDCFSLVVSEGPIRFVGRWRRLLNLFNRL